MSAVVVSTNLSTAGVSAVKELLADVTHALGFRPVSDQFWADLVHPGLSPLVTAAIPQGNGPDLIAYAQAAANESHADAWTVETVIAPGRVDDVATIGRELLAAIGQAVVARGGRELTWLVQAPTKEHDAIAAACGLVVARRLHQMRRPLPTGIDIDLVTRPFDAQRDVAEWVRVNARAFAWNPEQGGWTEATLRSRMDEPWFDPNGFLIHERDGRMAGFCWTKIHDDVEPRLGEIYVIGVDPDFQGLGLGRTLTLAGLGSLADRGIRTGMLFVDDDNVAAVRLYEKLGFEVHRTDAMYEKRLTS